MNASLLVLAASSALAASAPRVGRCVVPSAAGLREPSTLTGLMNCQRRKLDEAHETFFREHEADVPDPLEEAWSDQQAAEMRSYVARHPDRAAEGTVDSSPTLVKIKLARGTTKRKAVRRAGGRTLKAKLWAESDGGRKGITPEMARELAQRISEQQGSVSPDMQALLDAVSQDGANLTPDTMSKLREAARSADGAGLDLGVSPEIKDALLKTPDPDEKRDWERGSAADDGRPSL